MPGGQHEHLTHVMRETGHGGLHGDEGFAGCGLLVRCGAGRGGGQLAEPVTEVNLAGHFGALWEAPVAVGNDPDPNSSSGAPTCVFEGVQLSGV